jgi:protease-4
METLKDIFLKAIWTQRADRLQMTPEELSRGEIYHGSEAQKLGLIDEIGSMTDAIAAAAKLAQIRHYRVVDMSPELSEEEIFFGFKADGRSTAATIAAPPKQLPPGLYYRYIEPVQ